MGVKAFWRFEGKDISLNQLINEEGVCRTALATPGLLIISSLYWPSISKHRRKLNKFWFTTEFKWLSWSSVLQDKCIVFWNLYYTKENSTEMFSWSQQTIKKFSLPSPLQSFAPSPCLSQKLWESQRDTIHSEHYQEQKGEQEEKGHRQQQSKVGEGANAGKGARVEGLYAGWVNRLEWPIFFCLLPPPHPSLLML